MQAQNPAHEPDEFYETCMDCANELNECAMDLEMLKNRQKMGEWYTNEWAIVGLSVLAFGAGYYIGKEKRF